MSEVESWPQWQEPAEHRPGGTPARSDAAEQLNNLHAGLAQASAIVPLVGPAVVWAATRRDSPAHHQAAKAFNGQVAAAMAISAGLAPTIAIYAAMAPWFNLADFYGFHILFLTIGVIWGAQAVKAMISAFRGQDWTTPLAKVIRVRVIPEDDPHPDRKLRP